jgi:hypothetical protein
MKQAINKWFIIIGTAILILLLYYNYKTKVDSNAYKAPTDSQVQEFIETNNISFLDKKDIHNEYTIVPFYDGNQVGFYTLYSDHKGEVQSRYIMSSVSKKESKVFIAGISPKNPYAIIIIIDENLKKETKKAVVELSEGVTIEESGENKSSYILTNNKIENEKIFMSDIKLYNSSNEVIYSLNENWKNIN